MMGRRPNRSLHAPSTGKKMNCIRFHANPKYPVMSDARAMSPPSKRMIRLGNTGAIIPKARKSSITVTMMKTIVARDVPPWGMAALGAGNCSGLEGMCSRSAISVRF